MIKSYYYFNNKDFLVLQIKMYLYFLILLLSIYYLMSILVQIQAAYNDISGKLKPFLEKAESIK